MRSSVIDIGTNSVRLLVIEKEPTGWKNIYKSRATTRLGEGMTSGCAISKKAMERTLVAVNQLIDESRQYINKKPYIVATNAVREAKNQAVFLQAFSKDVGLDIEVLSGEEEAYYSFLGAKHSLVEVLPHPILVFDLGGGSTEFILKKSDDSLFIKSLPLGAVRMTEGWLKSDPPTTKEVEELLLHIKKIIAEIKEPLMFAKPYSLVGVGGTATTMATVSKQITSYDYQQINNTAITLEQVDRILASFLSSRLEERSLIKGLQPHRADIISAGALIVKTIMEQLEVKEFIVSEGGLMLGYLADQLK